MNSLTREGFNHDKKVNDTKNFDTGAIIATPKRQLIVQKHIIQRIDRYDQSTPFLHSSPL